MTTVQRNVIKHQKLRVKALGATLEGMRKILNETAGELHDAAFGSMERDPDEVWYVNEAADELFRACQKLDLAFGYLERAAGAKK